MEIGLLLVRVVLGLTLAAHGSQKLFGAFGGGGIAGTGGMFESLGFRPGRAFAILAGLGELCGGIGLVLGLLTPFASALVIAVMLAAIFSVHVEKGFFNENGGYEYPLINATAAAAVAFIGPGAVSLDAALGLYLDGVEWGFIAIGLGILGAVPPLVLRATGQRRTTEA